MYREYRGNIFGTFLGAAIFAALLFGLPSVCRASIIPQKILFQTDNFVQIVDQEELTPWFTADHRIVFAATRYPEIENPHFCPYVSLVCEAFISRHLREHLTTTRVFVLNETVARDFLTHLADTVERDPQDAKLKQENGSVTVSQEALPGQTLNIEKTFSLLKGRLENNSANSLTLLLALEKVPPRISSDTIVKLGIKELVSVGETDFSGSPKNRIYNIKRSIQQFDGISIAPGEEFSFVKFLGEVDGEHGYLPELVIKENKTEPEFGGGICQVSTTVFRAALNAGLKITARKNHAYPVRYYRPYGMDATVYIPNPDLRFMNNTSGHLIMFPEIVGNKLRFSFYGSKDGRTVTFDGPHILESNPDGSMRTIFTEIVTDAFGKTILSDKFPSNYKSPSLFPHPASEETIYTTKPDGWSQKQWRAYKSIHS